MLFAFIFQGVGHTDFFIFNNMTFLLLYTVFLCLFYFIFFLPFEVTLDQRTFVKVQSIIKYLFQKLNVLILLLAQLKNWVIAIISLSFPHLLPSVNITFLFLDVLSSYLATTILDTRPSNILLHLTFTPTLVLEIKYLNFAWFLLIVI